MRRLVIAIDFDDVLVDLIAMVIKHYNEIYHTNVKISDYYQPDPKPWGVNNITEASHRFHDITVKYHGELVPKATTVQVIKNLSAVHELHVVTGRRNELKSLTQELVNEHFPGCFKRIELTNYFDPVLSRSKSEVCKEIRADILVDDHVDHLREVLESGLKEVILYGNYPWNQLEALPDGVKRCINWNEVKTEINRIAEK